MKRLLLRILAAALAAALLSGCGQDTLGVVNTDGSTSMEKVMGALIEGYRDTADSVTVNFSGTGSGAGIEAALSGVCDIGLSSRALKDSEIAQGAQAHLVALDGVAVVVNENNPVDGLTVEQIAGIFTGDITNWRDVGGEDAPIAVYGREAGSGTRGAFEELVGVTDACRYTNEYSSTGDITGNVTTNPNAIGYVSLSGVRGGAKAIRVNGAACTAETVRDGSYPIQRPFLMVTRAGAPLSEDAQAFLEYAMSGAAAAYIARAGAVAP